MRVSSRVLLVAWLVGGKALPSNAAVVTLAGPPGGLCEAGLAAAELSRHLPEAFLAAIARVETGRSDPASGVVAPWPWAVNAEGVGTFYATKQAAMDAVRALQGRGIRSIDVGCLQVNLLQHPDAFASLDQAFDPGANAAYAADFLRSLFDQTGSWPLAAAAYHSMTPGIGSAYQQRVLAEWAVPLSAPRARRPAAIRSRAAKPPAAVEPAESKPASAWPGGTAVAQTASPMGRMISLSAPRSAPGRPVGTVGRNLAAYRLMPTRLAFRPPLNPG